MFELNDENKKYYKVLSVKEVSEQNLKVVEIMHIETEGKIILFICDDENRVFNIAFKTPVENGKGTPHILEHSVLCGSKKYNIKDPFIELAKGSMNTFLNAMTFPDKTCYPVASANLKDFHNLVDVYLDAVFYPNAIKNDKIFKQEGWHYEISNENGSLKVNGVVYNEMKGVYSDPDSIMESAVLANLFSDTNYAHDYGGNPDEIIDLTYDEFKSFHHKYYSATNAIIYYYGKLDFNYELTYLHNNYLKNLEKVKVDVEFKDVKNIIHDKEQISYYNIDSSDVEDKAYIAYSFALPHKKTSLDSIVMQIINRVLFSSDSAILKEKLMNEGFGESITVTYEAGLKNGFYSIVTKNINANKKESFIKEIISYIKKMIDDGLDIDKFKASINAIYFDYAEGEYGRYPRGLLFSLVSLDTYLYGDNPSTYIEYKEAFDFINKVDLSDKNNIFIKTLREVFVDNEWTAVNVLIPKNGYSKEKEDKLDNILKQRKDSMGTDGIKNVISDTEALKKYQMEKDSEEDIKSIPMLKISDIDKHKQIIDFDNLVIGNTDSIICYKNDKDIVYNEIMFDITDLKKEELYFLSLIKNLIAKIDLEDIGYKELNNYIDINTGGFDTIVNIFEKNSFLNFSIKSVNEKVDIAFDVFFKVLSKTIFNDKQRISLLLNEAKSESLLSILSSGHISSIMRSKSTDDYNGYVSDIVGKAGIGYNKFINAICKNYDANAEIINNVFYLLFKKILYKKMHFAVCVNKQYFDNVKNQFIKFKEKLDNNVLNNSWDNNDEEKLQSYLNKIKSFINFDEFDKKVLKEAIVTPSDVNFCAISGKFDKKLYDGKLYALKTLFNYEYLWTNIRVLGGAYGCMSSFSRTGTYSLVSYRDPNVSNTNKIYYEVSDFLKGLKKSKEETEKYIIGSIGAFDNPVSTVDFFNLNIGAYFNKQTDDDLNAIRTSLLNMKPEDFNELHVIFDNAKNASACALISENKVEEAKNEYDLVWKLQD